MFSGIASENDPNSLLHSPIIRSDEDRIKQVLLGLQSNALKFTQQGKVSIHIRISIKNSGKFLEISVIDTGVGIEYEDQDKLFKLFGFLQDTHHLNTHGIGLGLVISEQIVKQFGGRITFESVPKEGSTFTFTFKLEQENLEEAKVNYDYRINSREL